MSFKTTTVCDACAHEIDDKSNTIVMVRELSTPGWQKLSLHFCNGACLIKWARDLM